MVLIDLLTFHYSSHHSVFVFQTLDEMKLEMKPIKIDRRLTGSSFIDEPLQQVCVCVCVTVKNRQCFI